MSQLAPCPACARHVRIAEAQCPFCSASLDLSATPSPALPSRRLSRAAILAFGAALAAGVTTVGCGSDDDGGGNGGTGGQSTGGASSGGGSAGAGGTDGGAGSGGSAGQNTGGVAGNIAPPYGIPPDQ